MNPNHEAMDDQADWAVKHWEDVRCNGEPCELGQVTCPMASVCHAQDDDQSDSADAEVLLLLIRRMLWGMALGGMVWLLDELVSLVSVS